MREFDILFLVSYRNAETIVFLICLCVMREFDILFLVSYRNAETVQYFWKNWNIPVHKWASRYD